MACEKCWMDKPTIEKIDREGRVISICYDCLSTVVLHEEGRMMGSRETNDLMEKK